MRIGDDNESVQYGSVISPHNPYDLKIETQPATKYIIYDGGDKAIETYDLEDAKQKAMDIVYDNLKNNTQ